MKTFAQIRESKGDSEQIVFNKKIDGVPVKIVKEKNKFEVYIDGDELDGYGSQKQAEMMAKQFIKQFKENK